MIQTRATGETGILGGGGGETGWVKGNEEL